jgi:hypothetical protein
MSIQILHLRRREVLRKHLLVIERMRVNLCVPPSISTHSPFPDLDMMEKQTFASRALTKLRTRNFHLSSSVCSTTTRKLAFGSIAPVLASTSSICRAMRAMVRLTKASGQGSSSGAVRSATQWRVSACKSVVDCGTAEASMSARMSEMSIVGTCTSRIFRGDLPRAREKEISIWA